MSKVAITDYTFAKLDIEKAILSAAGAELCGGNDRQISALKTIVADADAVITQFAPINAEVISELLAEGKRVVALDVRPATERWSRVLGAGAKDVVFSDVSLIDRDGLAALMEKHGVSHVIHLAALLTPDCQQDPFRGCQVNVLGSTAVFDAARRAGSVRAIAFASSYAVYGSEGTKDSPPPMFYGAFKQAVDLIAEQHWTHFGLRSSAVLPRMRRTWEASNRGVL